MKQPLRRLALAAAIALLAIAGGILLFRPPPPRVPSTEPAKAQNSRLPRALRRELLGGGVVSFLPAPATGVVTRVWDSARHDGEDLTRPARPLRVAPRPPAAPTSEVILFLAAGTDPRALGAEYALTPSYEVLQGLSAWVFKAADPDAAMRARSRAANDPRVVTASLNRRIAMAPHSYVPNDPYYPAGSPASFPGQWHLIDANLPGAWLYELTGQGVTLAIVDDGLETAHPDLSGNFDSTDSLNFGSFPSTNPNVDPKPSYNGTPDENRHGTCVGGVAAAVGGNGIGVTGAAPKAALAVQRIDFNTLTDAGLAAAVGYHSTGGNTTIKVKNHSYGATETYVEDTAELSALAASAAAGTIHVFSAGNGFGTRLQDSNKSSPSCSPDGIAVAAIGSDLLYADYTSFGANVLVTAPSSTEFGDGITTTDRTGTLGYNPNVDPGYFDTFPNTSYTSVFGGTSSAAPLVTGIIVLAKQANPNMTLRMAQHALVRTSDLVDAGDSSTEGGGNGTTVGSAWKTNGGGFHFNQKYGYGRINAGAFVQQVVKYSGVTPLETATASATVNTDIPDNDATGLDRTFTLAPLSGSPKPLETIQVSLDLIHLRRGDLEAYLTSPTGTVCRLMISSLSDAGHFPDPSWPGTQWTFVSQAFWGETPVGTWHLRVRDIVAGTTPGTWNSFAVTAHMGSPILDTTPPTVVGLVRADATPTNANPVHFTVTFSEFVTGVNPADFALSTTGTLAGASITSVTGGPIVYTVTVGPGTGEGTLKLDLVDNDSIKDGNGNALGGAGAGNGNFAGPTYTVDRVAPIISSVTSTTADGLSTTGDAINITLHFSEPVSLVGGNLTVPLNSGASLTALPFDSQTSVSLTYTVAAGESSADLNVVSPLSLTSGSLQDAVGNDATLSIAAAVNLAFSRAIQVDAVSPTGGTVLDGFSGADVSTQTSTTTMAAHWSGFADAISGIASYRWGIGTSAGAVNVMPFTAVALATSASTSMANVALSLTPGATYFVSVEAKDGAGNTWTQASNGVQVVSASTLVPAPPGRLDAIVGPTSVRLDWIASPTPEVTYYRLWWKPAAQPWTLATLVDNLTGTSHTVPGLATGAAYDFLLRASTATGNESSGLFASGTTAELITVNGTGSYGTVQAAITAAGLLGGGTVTLQGGTYTENITLPGGVTLTGVSPKYTILTAATPAATVITATGTTVLSTIAQLTVTGGTIGVDVGIANIAMHNVVIHHNTSHGASSQAAGQLLAVNCTIMHNGGAGILAAGPTTLRNVIAGSNTDFGLSAPAASSVTYCDAYGNKPGGDYSAGLTLANDASTPVTFTDEPGNDYTEVPGAFSVDAGDPGDAYALEPSFNGNRVNLGAFGNTTWAATSPQPLVGGGGGGGGGCGLTGLEGLLLLLALRRRR